QPELQCLVSGVAGDAFTRRIARREATGVVGREDEVARLFEHVAMAGLEARLAGKLFPELQGLALHPTAQERRPAKTAEHADAQSAGHEKTPLGSPPRGRLYERDVRWRAQPEPEIHGLPAFVADDFI